ncbi:MAG: aldehyde dehydrogenase family protein [Candidatus Omnitrophica bacterium]|nr:aldehyde dehydrogenase family protein [Candidatus Omnitrophota bacterium]MDD3987358.1 aldehyde dehydrogenase family protein [Candidatus Omnitrophota bacterium]MDD5664983.1 aldehyde dehydrogenase family protein [Candidatus Omnitrophota bacterium]
MNCAPLYINGEFVETRERQNVLNPSTGKVIAQVFLASEKEIDLAVESARKAFDKGAWRGFSLKERKAVILRIAEGILNKAEELARIETESTGKPIKETTFMDVPSAAKTFEHAANNLENYLINETLAPAQEAGAVLLREPVGVVSLIIPWNYPLLIASWKLASALAAGNTVILKPSSITPLTAFELGKIIHEAGMPPGVVNIINASGAKSGQILCCDKRIDMVSFTGSLEVGKEILRYTSSSVKKLLLELGGKSASLVFADVDIETAVNSSLCSVFLNQGQMCTAMSRILVQEKIYDQFVASFVSKAKAIKLGLSDNHETQMGPLVTDSQRKKIIAYLEKAKTEGARILCGGKIPQDAELKNGYFFEPTVIGNVKPHMHIFKEEVFGPVAIVGSFSDSKEAVELANSSDFGLAACIWSKDLGFAEEVAKKINAGTIWINTYGMFYDQLPYGGFKQSGFGKELGRDGLLEYTRLKNIIIDHSNEGKPLVNYWYGF